MSPARPALLAALLAACAADKSTPAADDTGTAAACADDRPGLVAPVTAGVHTDTLDVPLPATTAPRAVPVHLWYPTAAATGAPAAYLGGLVPDADSLVDATPTPPPAGCRRPLVVYSHGYQAWGGNATALLRAFVARGYVAAAPDHTGNTLADNVEPKEPTWPLSRLADIRATLDHLAALPADHPLAGSVDPSRVLLLGHSMGGQTAWLLSGISFDPAAVDAACAERGCTDAERAAFDAAPSDARVAAIVPLAGDAGRLVADSSLAEMPVPGLYVTGTADFDGAPMAARAAGADLTWAEVAGACHESFTSSPVACDTLPAADGFTITATLAQAFALRTLRGVSGPGVDDLLDGSTPIHPALTLHPPTAR